MFQKLIETVLPTKLRNEILRIDYGCDDHSFENNRVWNKWILFFMMI
jgi:hypothetical protein